MNTDRFASSLVGGLCLVSVLTAGCGKDSNPVSPDPAQPPAAATPAPPAAASCSPVNPINVNDWGVDRNDAIPLITVSASRYVDEFSVDGQTSVNGKEVETDVREFVFEGKFETSYTARVRDGACKYSHTFKTGKQNADSSEPSLPKPPTLPEPPDNSPGQPPVRVPVSVCVGELNWDSPSASVPFALSPGTWKMTVTTRDFYHEPGHQPGSDERVRVLLDGLAAFVTLDIPDEANEVTSTVDVLLPWGAETLTLELMAASSVHQTCAVAQ